MTKDINKKAKDCNICSQVIYQKLNKNEEWELKRKNFWEQKLDENCVCSSPSQGFFYNTHRYSSQESAEFNAITFRSCQECKEEIDNVTINQYGDKKWSDSKKVKRHLNCFNKLLTKKFKEKNIASLEIRNNKLVIEYTDNNSSETISEKDLNDEQREIFQSLEEVLQEKQINKLTLSQLQASYNQENQQSDKPDYTLRVLGIIVLIVIIGIVGYYFFKRRRNK